MRAPFAITTLAALSLASCGTEAARDAKADEQHARLYEAVSEVICAADRSEREFALSSLAEEMGNANLLQEDGRIHEDTIYMMADDVTC